MPDFDIPADTPDATGQRARVLAPQGRVAVSPFLKLSLTLIIAHPYCALILQPNSSVG